MAAGVGITLTAASNVVFAELDWVPGNITQAEDRLHRIGQHNPVLVQHIVADGSLDARMAQVIVAKQEVITAALDAQHERKIVVPEAPIRKATCAAQVAVSQAMREAVSYGCRLLAGLDPDRAGIINNIGFNKLDGDFGHSLAEQDQLTDRQVLAGAKMLRKYKRQLPASVYTVLTGSIEHATAQG